MTKLRTSDLIGAQLDWAVAKASVAAMRAYVVSKLGDEVDIPEELLNEH